MMQTSHYNDEKRNRSSETSPPPVGYTVVISLAAVAACAILPELGFIALVLFAACIIFAVSGRAPVPVLLIPLLGVGAAWYRGGIPLLCAAAAVLIASFAAGKALRSGGNFHRALMTFTLVLLTLSAAGAYAYVALSDITVSHISDALRQAVHDAMADAISSVSGTLSLDSARLLTEQYDALARTAVLYIPATAGAAVAMLGIISLRLAGLFHSISGSTCYPMRQRIARADRVFAGIYFAAFLIGSFGTGVVSICAANVMIVLMLPAAAAGVSAYRGMLIRHRLAGRSGLPVSLIILIISFVFFLPAVGIMVLAITGTFAAFSKKR